MISLDLHFGKLTLATVYGMYQGGKEVQAGHLGGCGASWVRGGGLDQGGVSGDWKKWMGSRNGQKIVDRTC